MTVLILGGTAEARALARKLVEQDRPVVSSLAGRVSDPALPVGPVRVGGFGGPDGLAKFLVEQQIAAVVDATHPFAAQISVHAALATAQVGRPVIRLERPGWGDHPDATGWTWVADAAAAAVTGASAERPFLTTGRQSLAAFLAWSDRDALVRVVDPPEFGLPKRWRLLRSRGPYAYDDEHRLMRSHGVDLLVTKDSGGTHTVGKLDAARELGIPVLVIARPLPGSASRVVATLQEVVRWLDTLHKQPG